MRTYCKVWTIQASYICEYEFADTKPADGEMTDKENFYWSNISDILKEVKETERAGKIPKKYNLQSEHFTFYETYCKSSGSLVVKRLANDNPFCSFAKASFSANFVG